jgi:hypothetical protein
VPCLSGFKGVDMEGNHLPARNPYPAGGSFDE